MKVSQIVAFHGFMGVGADFIPLVERLGMSVYTPDLIGHGTFQSDNPLDYTLDTQLSYWAEHLPDRCTLVGYSMGGRLALQLALSMIEQLVEGPVDQVVIPKVGHCAHLEGLDKATEHLRHWLTLSVCGT